MARKGKGHIVEEFNYGLDPIPCSLLAAVLGVLPPLVLVPADCTYLLLGSVSLV